LHGNVIAFFSGWL